MRMRCLVVLGVFLMIGLSPTVSALAYNGGAAASYADQWWNYYNPIWPIMRGDDCTNFVSQALYNGGDTMVGYPGLSDSSWWMDSNNGQWTHSWTLSSDLYSFLNSGRGALRAIWYPPLNYAGDDLGSTGDVLVFDWGRGQGISHADIQVAYGTDPNYPSFSGSLVDQHSYPRYHEIWTLYPTNAWWRTTTAYVIHHN